MDVNFEEDKFNNSGQVAPIAPKDKGIAGLIIKTGLAKNAKQANIVMIVMIVLLAIIMYVLWPSSNASAPVIDPSVTPQAGLPN